MSEKSFSSLGLHKSDCPESDAIMDWCSTTRLREQLVAEIGELDKQLARLEALEGCPDFSLQQTCREMIHSRQAMFRQLRRS
jgi:hypothetical protein